MKFVKNVNTNIWRGVVFALATVFLFNALSDFGFKLNISAAQPTITQIQFFGVVAALLAMLDLALEKTGLQLR